jgi:hypothetical protein
VYKEELKELVRESLEDGFINNKPSIESELALLNLFISTFADGAEYSYDEYCQIRIKASLEACDGIDIDFNKEAEVTPREGEIIEGRAARKFYDGHGDYDDILKEEFIKWQVQKFFDLDRKVYFEISKHSTQVLLKKKIPFNVWNKKEDYFNEFCISKAMKFADKIANGNKEQNAYDGMVKREIGNSARKRFVGRPVLQQCATT